jgi:DNA polymerase-3 subunit gamma/tau
LHLGEGLRISVKVGATAGASLAAHEDRTRDEQQRAAIESIEQDPFIKKLQQDFDVKIVRGAIRPAQ